jgi:hypothetical protein
MSTRYSTGPYSAESRAKEPPPPSCGCTTANLTTVPVSSCFLHPVPLSRREPAKRVRPIVRLHMMRMAGARIVSSGAGMPLPLVAAPSVCRARWAVVWLLGHGRPRPCLAGDAIWAGIWNRPRGPGNLFSFLIHLNGFKSMQLIQKFIGKSSELSKL